MNPSALTHLFQEELYQFKAPLVVVLARAWESYTSEDHMLLKKILTSVKVDMNSIQIVVAPTIDIMSLQIYSPARVLIFGSQTKDVVDKYQLATAQAFTVIRADDLNALDEQKKKNLWLALRQMFGV